MSVRIFNFNFEKEIFCAVSFKLDAMLIFFGFYPFSTKDSVRTGNASEKK